MKKQLLTLLACIALTTGSLAQFGWQVSTLAGNGTTGSNDGAATVASFNYYSEAVCTDAAGNVYVLDKGNNKVRKVTAAGVVTTLADLNSYYVYANPGTAFEKNGICADPSGNIYVALCRSNKIIKITPAGSTTLFAGSPSASTGSANGNGTNASFNFPSGLCSDAAGNIYVADAFNSQIRKIAPNGDVTSCVGFGGGYQPQNICKDASDNLYVTGLGGQPYLQIIDPSHAPPLVTTTTLRIFGDIVFDNASYSIISTNNNGVYQTVLSGGFTTAVTKLIAGDGFLPSCTDAVGTKALFDTPKGICQDASGNFYIADVGNRKIRKMQYVNLTPPVPSYNNLPTSMCLGSNANYQPAVTGSQVGLTVLLDSSITMPAPKAICRNKNGVFVLSAADSVLFYDFNGNLQHTYNTNPWYSNVTAIAADDNNRLYLAAPDMNNPAIPNIYRLDAQGNIDFNFSITSYQINSLSAMAFGPGYLYAVDTLGPYIHVIDTTTALNITLSQLPQPSNNQYSWYKPTSMVFGSNGQMYLADVGNKTIVARNASDNNYYVVDSLLGTHLSFSIDLDTTIANSTTNNTFYITSNTASALTYDAISRVSTENGGQQISEKDTIPAMHLRNPMSNVYVNQGSGIPVNWVANSGGNNVMRFSIFGYSITPSLPAGLSYNFINGKIIGTATSPAPFTTYTIVTASSAGSNTTTIGFSVVAPAALSTATGTTSSAVVDQADGLTVNYFNTSDCSQMISIKDDQGGTVMGNTIATQTVYPTIATFNADQFVGRVTEVATQSPDSALAHVTLNFSYQDIVNYNSSVAPTFTLSNDTSTTMSVGVLQTHTTKKGSIHPISHSPITANWVPAAPNQGHWEVKFDVTKFSTFYMADVGSVTNFTCATGSADTIVTTNTAYYWHNDSLYFDGDYADTLVNATGCDSICTLNLTFNTTTGIGTPLLSNSTKVYPNPSTGLLNITVNNPNVQVNSIRITNLIGQEVYSSSENNHNLQLDLSNLPKGYYTVTLTSKQECVNKKILIE